MLMEAYVAVSLNNWTERHVPTVWRGDFIDFALTYCLDLTEAQYERLNWNTVYSRFLGR